MSVVVAPASARSWRVTGLANGTDYDVSVAPFNMVGTGPAVTRRVTPVAPPVTANPPGPCASYTLTPGDGLVTASWTPPTATGGAPITGYRLSRGGVVAASPAATDRAHTFTGLTNGTSVTYELAAVNDAGVGAALTRTATPTGTGLSAPTPVQSVTVTPGAGSLGVAWVAPVSNGGSSITGYELTVDGALVTTVDPKLRSWTLTGLTAGQTYRVGVAARNLVGLGAAAFANGVPTVAGSTFDPMTYDFRPKSSGGTVGVLPSLSRATRASGYRAASAGTTENMTIGGSSDVLVSQHTFSNVSSSASFVLDSTSSSWGVWEDCDLTGPGQCVVGTGMTVRRCHVGKDVAGNDLLNPTLKSNSRPSSWQPSLIEYCYLRRHGQVGSAHNDAFQVWSGGKIVIRRNKIDAYYQQIILKSDYGRISDVLIEENLILGDPNTPADCIVVLEGAANVDAGASNNGFPTYITIRNNRFGAPWTTKKASGIRVINSVNTGLRDEAIFVASVEDRQRAVAAGATRRSGSGKTRTAAEWIVWQGNTYTDGTRADPPSAVITYP